MRNWTIEARTKQATIIHQWQPLKKAGVKTPEGKAISCMNAYKHGGYGKESHLLQNTIRDCRKMLNKINNKIEINSINVP